MVTSSRIINQTHFLWKVIPEVRAICEPLFQETGIAYFNYARAYNDGSIAGLFTHPEWLLHSLVNSISPSGAEFSNFPQFGLAGSDIQPFLPQHFHFKKYEKAVTAFKEVLGLDYMLLINYNQLGYYEAFSFASTNFPIRFVPA